MHRHCLTAADRSSAIGAIAVKARNGGGHVTLLPAAFAAPPWRGAAIKTMR